MDGELERVLQKLEEAKEFARTYRFEMTADYRALIEQVEAMPRNQAGADKSGRWIGSYADAKAFFDAFSRASLQ
jgi:excinuclease UvrABC nuclease subunit